MTLNKLASLIAKREGKKHQASIGDIREILKIIVEIDVEAQSWEKSSTRVLVCTAADIINKIAKRNLQKVRAKVNPKRPKRKSKGRK